jgi:hypothetical protein
MLERSEWRWPLEGWKCLIPVAILIRGPDRHGNPVPLQETNAA